MTLKTYQAATMAEALAQVKLDMGRNAVILHTRSFRKGGLMGLIGGRSMWEVTASPNANVPSRAVRHSRRTTVMDPVLNDNAFDRGQGEYLALHGGAAAPARETFTERTSLTASTGLSDEVFHDIGIEEIDAELAKLLGPATEEIARGTGILPAARRARTGSPDQVTHANAVGNGKDADKMSARHEAKMASPHAGKMPATHEGETPSSQMPSPHSTPYREFHEHLLRQDVEEGIVADLMDKLRLSLAGMDPYEQAAPDSKLIADRLCDLIASRINVAAPAAPTTARLGRPHVIALIGPTGVGKTTTLAKLAANYKLQRRCRVGLVTLDTYRIAAVEQLRTYAEIIEVPLRTVLSAGELHQAVHGMKDVDVVLIDTAGRSQNDQPRLNELRTMLTAAGADEVHLLISATSNRRCARNILHRFGSLGVTRIVMTKLDEAETFGTILSFSAEPDAPLSFVTTGQDVPDDIEPADPWQLAQRVLKGR